MRTLESALRNSAQVLRQRAASLPDRRWESPGRRHVARGIVVGLTTAALVVVVFAIPGLLTSPSGNDPSNMTPSVIVSSQPPDTLAETDTVSPVLDFQTGGMSSDEFHNLTQQSLASCMEDRGWSYEPTLQDSPFAEPRTVGELREFREAHGYGLYTQPEPSGPSPKRAAEENHANYLALDEDQQLQWRTDFNGDISGEGEEPVEGSCEALADHAVDIPQTDQEVMVELAGLYNLAMRSDEYVMAEDAWRTCLVDRGYEMAPEEYAFSLVDEMYAAEAAADEIAAFEVTVAVDDFECAFTTTMPVRHRLETEIVEELITRYPRWEAQDETE